MLFNKNKLTNELCKWKLKIKTKSSKNLQQNIYCLLKITLICASAKQQIK